MSARRRILLGTTAALLAVSSAHLLPRDETTPSSRPPASAPPPPRSGTTESFRLSVPPAPSMPATPSGPDLAALPPTQASEAAFAAWTERDPRAALAATLAPDATPFIASLQSLAAEQAARRDLAALLVWLAEAPDTRATPAVLFAAARVATETHPDPRPEGALALLLELIAALPPSAARENLWPAWLERHLDAHPRVAADWLPEPPPSLPVTP